MLQTYTRVPATKKFIKANYGNSKHMLFLANKYNATHVTLTPAQYLFLYPICKAQGVKLNRLLNVRNSNAVINCMLQHVNTFNVRIYGNAAPVYVLNLVYSIYKKITGTYNMPH